jgi:type IV secretion system protein VirB7
MKQRWLISMLFIGLLSGCTKPPDLNAPCQQFGKFCSQLPINEEPITEVSK